MNDFKILVSTVFAAFMAFMPAVAQDKIITKDGDVLQGWNVEVSDKYVFYNTENKTDADIKRMEKDKVLMVKRQDGSTLNLYEDAQPAAKQAPAASRTGGRGSSDGEGDGFGRCREESQRGGIGSGEC